MKKDTQKKGFVRASKSGDIGKEKMLKALSENYGFVSTAAEIVGISRHTHYKWLREDPIYAEAVEMIHEKKLDDVECKLMQHIESGSETAVYFFLNHRGKSRGYNVKEDTEQPKIEITVNSPLGDASASLPSAELLTNDDDTD
jgi:hypothetical protein